MTDLESNDAAWERALDDLEAHLVMAEQLMLGRLPIEMTPWSAPALPTPLPSGLVERARGLLARQEALLTQLPETMDRTRRQRDLTQRISAVSSPARPASIYIDATA